MQANFNIEMTTPSPASQRPPTAIVQPDVETSSDRYALRFRGSVGSWFLDVQKLSVLALLADLGPGASILEVGAGHAQLVPALLAAAFVVTAFGSDPTCGHRLAPWANHERFRFDVGDLLRLPYPDRSFDAVVSIRLLGHVPEWRRLLGELCRVSRRVVVVDGATTRSLNVLAGRFFAMKSGIEGDTRPFTVFRPSDVAATFEQHSFRLRATTPQFLLPMALHRFLRSAALGRALEAPARALGLTRAFGSPVLFRADRSGPAR